MNVGRVEYAAGGRSVDFPEEWGDPEGRPGSEERARWVKERVLQHERSGESYARMTRAAQLRQDELESQRIRREMQLFAYRYPRYGPTP